MDSRPRVIEITAESIWGHPTVSIKTTVRAIMNPSHCWVVILLILSPCAEKQASGLWICTPAAGPSNKSSEMAALASPTCTIQCWVVTFMYKWYDLQKQNFQFTLHHFLHNTYQHNQSNTFSSKCWIIDDVMYLHVRISQTVHLVSYIQITSFMKLIGRVKQCREKVNSQTVDFQEGNKRSKYCIVP